MIESIRNDDVKQVQAMKNPVLANNYITIQQKCKEFWRKEVIPAKNVCLDVDATEEEKSTADKLYDEKCQEYYDLYMICTIYKDEVDRRDWKYI